MISHDPGMADTSLAAGVVKPGEVYEGSCRRFPPTLALSSEADPGLGGRMTWPRTAAGDWCGEWQACETPSLDEAEETWLRNASAAQSLLVLSTETRDELLSEILTQEEMEMDAPPDDFYDRVQQYFARRKGGD